jgi:hypothetical protein
MEMNLFDPQCCFVLGMGAEVGEFIANQTSKKSIECRIERAREKGWPTSGRHPFGRTFDKETGAWGIDPVKHERIVDVAERYLRGESMRVLAKECGTSSGRLTLILREQCSDTWVQEFRVDRFQIHEVVQTRVPRLLPEATIRAVRRRLQDKRTRLHGKPKHQYLLNGFVFCSACGTNLTGQVTHHGGPGARRYYRHRHDGLGAQCFLRPRPWVRSDDLESAVFDEIFRMFGNKPALERAMKAAIPQCDQALKRRERLQADLAKGFGTKLPRRRRKSLETFNVPRLTGGFVR